MPIGTPFHDRTKTLCKSFKWKDWAGFYAVCHYDISHEREYYAFRHSAGLIDVSPLFKFDITGFDAGKFLSYITVKDVEKLKPGQVTYLCWCDDKGKVIDDGTVSKFSDSHYRVTSAEPTLYWFEKHKRGFQVKIEDISNQICSLSLQGPQSKKILREVSNIDMDKLKFFKFEQGLIGKIPVIISRTGYTGDLGYEIWTENKFSINLWDELIQGGGKFGIEPCGLDAMDVTRIEAGFILNGIDYYSSSKCLIDKRKSSPYEINLGFTVQLNRDRFIGQEALITENLDGPVKKLVGLDLSWTDLEKLHEVHGLPPQICNQAWRTNIPIYENIANNDKNQIGYATSGTWSPILKKNLALATLQTEFADIGNEVQFEVMVEYERKTITGIVIQTPFFNPARKRE